MPSVQLARCRRYEGRPVLLLLASAWVGAACYTLVVVLIGGLEGVVGAPVGRVVCCRDVVMGEEKTPLPPWIRRSWAGGRAHQEVKDLLDGLGLHTVCQSAHCPNHSECWGRHTATFLLMGNVCTRHCRFCAVNSGRPGALDPEEPGKVAEAVRRLGLQHVVLTTVTRDDLEDEGAGHVAACVGAVKELHPETTVEVLVPDFGAKAALIGRVLDAHPEVYGHNIETVERLQGRLRDRRFGYETSLAALRQAAELAEGVYVKSSLMAGCGETEEEVRRTLEDLRATGCSVVSMGQYLQPSPRHAAVVEYVPPEQFKKYEAMAYEIGFTFAVAGPFVRSSYRSEELLHPGAAASRPVPGGVPRHEA